MMGEPLVNQDARRFGDGESVDAAIEFERGQDAGEGEEGADQQVGEQR